MTQLGGCFRIGLGVALLLAADRPHRPIPTAFRSSPAPGPSCTGCGTQSLQRQGGTGGLPGWLYRAATLCESPECFPSRQGAPIHSAYRPGTSLDTCGPPELARHGAYPRSPARWAATLLPVLGSGPRHHDALVERWREDGIFCLLYSARGGHLRNRGPPGSGALSPLALLNPSSLRLRDRRSLVCLSAGRLAGSSNRSPRPAPLSGSALTPATRLGALWQPAAWRPGKSGSPAWRARFATTPCL